MLFPLPFIWFPKTVYTVSTNQLPYLVEADRAQNIVHHVPESAKIYADRVQENVPIISESVSLLVAAALLGNCLLMLQSHCPVHQGENRLRTSQ